MHSAQPVSRLVGVDDVVVVRIVRVVDVFLCELVSRI